MGRIAIFIDGAYLDYTLRNEFGGARVDFRALSAFLAEDHEILRTYYYHCLPYQSNPPTPEESVRFKKMQSFTDRLQKLPRYEVRLGKLAYRGLDEETRKPIFEQKQVDILLAVDLVRLAATRQITHAVLISGDSDFLPAVKVAKDMGVLVILWHGTRQMPHRDLWQECDERHALTAEGIAKCGRQRPVL